MKSCPCGRGSPSYASEGSRDRESPVSGVQAASFLSLSAALLPQTSIDGVISDDAKNACTTTKQAILRGSGSRNAPAHQGKRRIVAYSTPARPRDNFRAEQLLNVPPQSHQPPNGTKIRRTAPLPTELLQLSRSHLSEPQLTGKQQRSVNKAYPKKMSSKQKFPPQGVKQQASSKPASRPPANLTAGPPRTTANYRAPMHQALGFGFKRAGVGKRDERIHNRRLCGVWSSRPGAPRPAASNGHHAQ